MACGVLHLFLFKPSSLFRRSSVDEDPQLLHRPVDRISNQACSITVGYFNTAANRFSLYTKSISVNASSCLRYALHPKCVPHESWLTLVSSMAHDVRIYGYWMGPDVEDGWGYIEAAIDKSK